MNKTKIDWAEMSWNPVTGCRHGCPYCYARRTAHRFDARLEDHSKRRRGRPPRPGGEDQGDAVPLWVRAYPAPLTG